MRVCHVDCVVGDSNAVGIVEAVLLDYCWVGAVKLCSDNTCRLTPVGVIQMSVTTNTRHLFTGSCASYNIVFLNIFFNLSRQFSRYNKLEPRRR